jgi:hypothetical protein
VHELSEFLAVVMLTVAAYCVARLVLSFARPRRTQRDADVVHTVMGVSMAGMLAPSLAAGPTGLWLLVFCASTVWFGWRVVREADRARAVAHPLGQHVPHLLMSGAMVYMLVVVAWSGSTGSSHQMRMVGMNMGAAASRWPLLTVALAVLLLGDGVLTFGRNLRQVQVVVPLRESSLALAGGGSSRFGSTSVMLDGRPTATPGSTPALTPGSSLLAPRSVMVCQLVMSLVMGYMLVSLL